MSERKIRLTTAQADAIQKYIWSVRDLLNLRHWDTFLSDEPVPREVQAQVRPVEGRYVASIHLAHDWLKREPWDQRNDIVHELVHLTHREQTDVIRVGLLRSGLLPRKTEDLLWTNFRDATERMVDHLATAIAETFPLPEIPDATTGEP